MKQFFFQGEVMKLFLLIALSLINYSVQAACSKDGLAIMKEQEKRNSVTYESQVQSVVLLDVKSKQKEKRTMKHYSHKAGSGKEKALLTFVSPADIKGSAVLNWRESSSEDQWVYLPGLKKLQRIASGSKRKYFMGTDFTFADLEGEVLKNYDYICEKETPCPSKKGKCFVITAKPKNSEIKKSTGYTKRTIWVEKTRLVTERIDYYNLKGKKFKHAEYLKWVKEGNVYRPNLAIMSREKKHKTYLKVTKRDLKKKIDDVTFSKRYIEKEMHVK